MTGKNADHIYKLYIANEIKRIHGGALLRRLAINSKMIPEDIQQKLLVHGFWGLTHAELHLLRIEFTNHQFDCLHQYYNQIIADAKHAIRKLERTATNLAATTQSAHRKQLTHQVIVAGGLLETLYNECNANPTLRQWESLAETATLTEKALRHYKNKNMIDQYRQLHKRVSGGVYLNNKVVAAVSIFCGLLVFCATLPIIAFAILASPPVIIAGAFTTVLGLTMMNSGYNSYKSDKQLAEANQYPELVATCRFFYRTLRYPPIVTKSHLTVPKMKMA